MYSILIYVGSYKKLSYRKETVRLLHNTEIRVLHLSHIVLIGLFRIFDQIDSID